MDIKKQRQIQLEHYKKEAANYNRKYKRENRCHRKKIDLIVEALEIKPGETVLEVGVGTGIHAEWLIGMHAGENIRFIGCDLSPEMIEQSRRRLTGFDNVSLFVSPGESLPLSNASVDKAYISGSLHHFADRKKGIEELIRVVRSGGIIVISEPNIFCPWNFLQVLWQFKTDKGIFFTTPRAISSLYKGLPVKVVRQEFFNFTPPFPEFASRFFDRIDIVLGWMPFVRHLASMSITVVRRL